MVRIIGIALVILGLIAQPLMAAMPDSMPIGESLSSISTDRFDLDIGMSDHGAMGTDQPSQAPCHETATEDTVPMSCTDCDSDCANGACASACSLSTIAVLTQSLLKFEQLSAVRVVGASGALVQGLPSRIFHPPKHA
jgi:hypothetical protein